MEEATNAAAAGKVRFTDDEIVHHIGRGGGVAPVACGVCMLGQRMRHGGGDHCCSSRHGKND
jgi:hypothetical protein